MLRICVPQNLGAMWTQINARAVTKHNAINFTLLDCTFKITHTRGVRWRWSQNSSVGIATGYGLDERRAGVRVPVGSRIFSTAFILILGPSLLSNGYRGLFRWGVKLTTHLQLMQRSRKRGSIHPLPHTAFMV
jgi:hypothetical protein